MARKTNEAGLNLIKQHEGCRLTAYQDVAGIWTIGYGHIKGVHPGMQMTQQQADQTLADDLAGAEAVVESAKGGVSTTDDQFAAMVSLCFNIGSGNFRPSSPLREHRAGNGAAATDAFLMWNKAHVNGQLQPVAGLTNRRQAERQLYLTAWQLEPGILTHPKGWTGCLVVIAMVLGAPAGSVISGAGTFAPSREWLGKWLVVKDLGAPGISAITDAQARALIGASIVIADGTARFADDSCTKATYTVETQTIEDFLLTFQLTPLQLPLRGARVHTLEVSCSGAPFHDLSLVDSGCTILTWNGRFFQVARSEASREVRCLHWLNA
jgi:lysozyme